MNFVSFFSLVFKVYNYHTIGILIQSFKFLEFSQEFLLALKLLFRVYATFTDTDTLFPINGKIKILTIVCFHEGILNNYSSINNFCIII